MSIQKVRICKNVPLEVYILLGSITTFILFRYLDNVM